MIGHNLSGLFVKIQYTVHYDIYSYIRRTVDFQEHKYYYSNNYYPQIVLYLHSQFIFVTTVDLRIYLKVERILLV